jgi:hypothetical protein
MVQQSSPLYYRIRDQTEGFVLELSFDELEPLYGDIAAETQPCFRTEP